MADQFITPTPEQLRPVVEGGVEKQTSAESPQVPEEAAVNTESRLAALRESIGVSSVESMPEAPVQSTAEESVKEAVNPARTDTPAPGSNTDFVKKIEENLGAAKGLPPDVLQAVLNELVPDPEKRDAA
jgi:hypothetical protein